MHLQWMRTGVFKLKNYANAGKSSAGKLFYEEQTKNEDHFNVSVIFSTPVLLCGAWITNWQNLNAHFHAKFDLNWGSLVKVMTGPLNSKLSSSKGFIVMFNLSLNLQVCLWMQQI